MTTTTGKSLQEQTEDDLENALEFYQAYEELQHRERTMLEFTAEFIKVKRLFDLGMKSNADLQLARKQWRLSILRVVKFKKKYPGVNI